MNLTTLELVKLYLANDNGKDALLTALIPEVSARAVKLMKRDVETVSRTEYFDVFRGMASVQLCAWPCSIATVYNDTSRTFATGSEISANNYTVTDYGRLKFDFILTPGPQALKVVHSSGMATTDVAFVEAYPDIAGAIAKQVAYEALRDKNLGSDAFSFAGGGSIGVTNSIDWLPMVKDLLMSYARAD